MQKGRPRQLKPQIQTYRTGVQSVFIHPYTCVYVLICEGNVICLYDIPTMSIVGISMRKFEKGEEPKYCIFTQNMNKFYTLSSCVNLNRYELLANCKLSDKNMINGEFSLNMLAVSKMMKNNMFHMLTAYNFILFSIANLPPFKISFKHLQEGQKILSGHNLRNQFWILASNRRILAIQLNFREEKAFINPLASVQVDKMPIFPQLFIDSKNNLISLLNSASVLHLYLWNGNFNKIFTSKVYDHKKLSWISYLHFGTSTSTVNKYENTIALLIHTEQISTGMVEEKKELVAETEAYIIEVNQSIIDQPELKPMVVKGIRGVKRQPWHCEFMENKISYLTNGGELQSADLVTLLEGKNNGKEWVNLSYRFEALEENEQYEQLQDQFERVNQNKEENEVEEWELCDWSQCLVTKEQVNKGKLNRLNCFQF